MSAVEDFLKKCMPMNCSRSRLSKGGMTSNNNVRIWNSANIWKKKPTETLHGLQRCMMVDQYALRKCFMVLSIQGLSWIRGLDSNHHQLRRTTYRRGSENYEGWPTSNYRYHFCKSWNFEREVDKSLTCSSKALEECFIQCIRNRSLHAPRSGSKRNLCLTCEPGSGQLWFSRLGRAYSSVFPGLNRALLFFCRLPFFRV